MDTLRQMNVRDAIADEVDGFVVDGAQTDVVPHSQSSAVVNLVANPSEATVAHPQPETTTGASRF